MGAKFGTSAKNGEILSLISTCLGQGSVDFDLTSIKYDFVSFSEDQSKSKIF